MGEVSAGEERRGGPGSGAGGGQGGEASRGGALRDALGVCLEKGPNSEISGADGQLLSGGN